MNQDANDLLYSNTYIPKISSIELNIDRQEFQEYFEQEKIKRKRDSLLAPSKNINLDLESKRFIKTVKTFASIDSRDRDTIAFPNPNTFRIFLGKTFINVKSIRLASMEFPNTASVISSSNNLIYWRNKRDIELNIIDTITQTYPVYKTSLHTGSYVVNTLQTEIGKQLKLVKRENNFGDFHYFLVNLDINTDVVTFTSLILTQLPNNPFTTVAGTGVISVNAPSHGYTTGQVIYFIGAVNSAGITGTEINDAHSIIVINDDTFQFETVTKANTSGSAGGGNTKTGKLAPFQLLYGEYSGTIAPKIGFLNENSSQQLVVNITSMQNLYLAHITMSTPHGINVDSIGTLCSINGSNTSPSIDGNKTIIQILSSNSIIVSINSPLIVPSINNGQITIGANTFDVSSIENFINDTILVEFFTAHRYTPLDSGKKISLFNTTTTPIFDGENTIFSVISDTRLVLYGKLLPSGGITTSVYGEAGFIPVFKPLESVYKPITDITTGGTTIITCPGHLLKVGDSIRLFNLYTIPPVRDIYNVNSVLNSDQFSIDFYTLSFENTTILDGTAAIGTSLVYLTFPNHGFNNITSITNASSGTADIQTLLPHGLTTGDTVRIMQTNCFPIVDGHYIITVVNVDVFNITIPLTLTTIGTFGIIGMNQDFFLYNSDEFGGFTSDVLNNNRFIVRDIIDQNTLTFIINANYSTKSEMGGGSSLYMNSLLHGFNGVQTNTKNGVIDKSISLEGENYCFLVCPQLGTMLNTGSVENIFARIILDQSPGAMIFNFLSNPKTFDVVPLDKLEYLDFSIVNYDGSLYDFNYLNYSFTIEITEVIDTSEHFNISSRRGIQDTRN